MPAATVSDEIRQLMRSGPSRGAQQGRRYSQRQAVAASLNMARRGEFGPKAARKAKRSGTTTRGRTR
jgi:hypothetical protein